MSKVTVRLRVEEEEVGKGLEPVVSAFYPPVPQRLLGPSGPGEHGKLSQCILFYLATHISVVVVVISMLSVDPWLGSKIYPLPNYYLDNLSIWKALALGPIHLNN